jgi:co-chaperonin GroES (HSP10)
MKFKKALKNFIVKVENPYNEEYDLGGIKLMRPSHTNEFDNINKFGVVMNTVEGSGVPEGAILHFHHFVVEWRDKNISQKYCIDKKEGIYRVPYCPMGNPDMLVNNAYAWEKDGEVHSINDWILVEQVREDFAKTESGLFIVEKIDDTVYASGENKPKKNYARVAFSNPYFESMGLQVGDTIIHKDGAEYPIEIQGTTYWRVWEEFLLAKIDE